MRKTGRLIIAHEAHRRLGLGAEIAALVQEHAFDYLDAPIVRVGAMDIPIPASKPLEDVALPGKTQILQAIRHIVDVAVGCRSDPSATATGVTVRIQTTGS